MSFQSNTILTINSNETAKIVCFIGVIDLYFIPFQVHLLNQSMLLSKIERNTRSRNSTELILFFCS
jgi:hypothetical protein